MGFVSLRRAKKETPLNAASRGLSAGESLSFRSAAVEAEAEEGGEEPFIQMLSLTGKR